MATTIPAGIDMAAIRALSVDDRVLLAHAILDEIATEAENAPLSEELAAELDRRISLSDADPGRSTPWEVVRERVRLRVLARRAEA